MGLSIADIKRWGLYRGSAAKRAALDAMVSGAWNPRYPSGTAAQARGQTALAAIALAATRCVDVVMIGDSNQGYNAYGFAQGVAKFLAGLYGMYATAITTPAMVAHYGSSGVDASGLSATGAAATLATLWGASTSQASTTGYRHLASGTSSATGGVQADANFPTQDALRAWFCSGLSASYTGGSFKPGMRLGVSPYSSLATYASTISCVSDFDGLFLHSVDLAADATRAGKAVEARFAVPGGTVTTGPFTEFYSRIERSAVNAGVSVHTLYYIGGQSAWNMANDLNNTPDATLSAYFAEVRRLQLNRGQAPVVVVYINSGLNDRNETNQPSLGPARVVAPSGAAAFVDNHRAIQTRIYNIWRNNGWDMNELYWLLVPSHRISDADDANLVAYRAALATACAADPQTSVVDLGARMTYAAANAAGWYAAGQNQLHLTNTGYDGVSALIFQ